jgi:hypothetical protein
MGSTKPFGDEVRYATKGPYLAWSPLPLEKFGWKIECNVKSMFLTRLGNVGTDTSVCDVQQTQLSFRPDTQ